MGGSDGRAKGGEGRGGRQLGVGRKGGREGARIFAVAPERMVTRRRQPLNATATSGEDRRRTEPEPASADRAKCPNRMARRPTLR